MSRNGFFLILMVVSTTLWGGNIVGGKTTDKVVLAIHGGTGIEKAELTPKLAQDFREGLVRALHAGFAKYEAGSSTDMVEAAVRSLEDNPLFNAGKGAVFNEKGQHELDAAIMEGKTLKAGSVAGVRTVKNPVSLARLVMEKTPHVLLVGSGADRFAKKAGATLVDQKYFYTARRWKYLLELRALDKASQKKLRHSSIVPLYPERHTEWSTVGAVALDKAGDLGAATSTGGVSNKMEGRVGDSPIIGAGTYADNRGCAVSATGHGEFFIRYAVAHEIDALVRYAKASLQEAADQVIKGQLKRGGGDGGVITLNPKGEVAFSFNSEGLYRGYITESGETWVALYEN